MKSLNEEIAKKYPDEKILVGCGNLDSPIVLIGEAPGANEIKLGAPFVGQAGKHLEEFLEILELNREDIYITNAVKYRPTRVNPKTGRLSNRTPTSKEIDDFRYFLYREIAIIEPEIIVTLGNIPLKSIYDKDMKIGKVHGQLMNINIHGIDYKVFPLYHPAAVIYRKELRGVYIGDLYHLKKEIKVLDIYKKRV